jgi:hypothetical protein
MKSWFGFGSSHDPTTDPSIPPETETISKTTSSAETNPAPEAQPVMPPATGNAGSPALAGDTAVEISQGDSPKATSGTSVPAPALPAPAPAVSPKPKPARVSQPVPKVNIYVPESNNNGLLHGVLGGAAVVAGAGLLWGVYQWFTKRKEAKEEPRRRYYYPRDHEAEVAEAVRVRW